MRIKCPHCNGKGFSELNSALNMACGWCMGKGELDLEIVPTEPQTEQEYIQTCNTEQLAKTIHQLIDGGLCGLCRWDCRERCIVHKEEDEIKIIVEWLKQPHSNK